MSQLVLAEKDPDVVIAEALERYRQRTGVTLAPADPRRLHLEALLLELCQMRPLIDFSGKQSLLRYVSGQYIRELAALWGEEPLPAKPSTTVLRFHFPTVAVWEVLAGKRATDGLHVWSVKETTHAPGAGRNYVDADAECTVTGSATNGVAIGQIATLVDNVPGCTSVENLTVTKSGRDIESTEDFRERLRSVPEARSTCGPREAYRAEAFAASASVADVSVLGPDDSASMSGSAPTAGQVFVKIIQGTRDANGVLVEVVPEPDPELITTVSDALTAEDVRPLGDEVIVSAPTFVDFDVDVRYYIARSRKASEAEIRTAVEAAHAAYVLGQCRIGKDINPSELITALVNAGAKRVTVTSPSFTRIYADECPNVVYDDLYYGGIEND